MILTRDGKEITAIYRQDGSEVEEVKDANGRIVYLASREITGALPLYFYSRGKPLTDYLISGNTVQDGTPSPDMPVDVVGCGVRTKNLLDNQMSAEVNYRGVKYTKNADGSVKMFGTASPSVSYCILMGDGAATNNIGSFNTPILKAGEQIIFSTGTTECLRIRFTDGTYGAERYTTPGVPITVPKDIGLVYVQVNNQATVDKTIYPMIRHADISDSTYQPYGYKLPLTVNSTEYPIYLGEVPTTRRIKKLVLTGEEDWGYSATGTRNYISIDDAYARGNRLTQCYCSHYACLYNGEPIDAVPNNSIYINLFNNRARFFIKTEEYQSADSFKSYLAAQYAAGTPVTIWYILAEPETGIVNEPLHKIGDYADTISFAQAGVTIPTVSGVNVLDTTLTVKPSEVYIKGRGIKPTG